MKLHTQLTIAHSNSLLRVFPLSRRELYKPRSQEQRPNWLRIFEWLKQVHPDRFELMSIDFISDYAPCVLAAAG